jgi:OOP family OmpA-OmpF porin
MGRAFRPLPQSSISGRVRSFRLWAVASVLNDAIGVPSRAVRTFAEWVRGVGTCVSDLLQKPATWAIATATLLSTQPASAQTATFLLDRAQLSGAPDDGFMVYRPYQGEETRVYVNGALGFSLNPLRDDNLQEDLRVEGGAPITGQFPVYLSAGLQLQGIIGLNLHIPFTPVQITGATPPPDVGVGITDENAAMNDIRFDGRLMAYESNNRRFRAGMFGAFSIATGSETGFGGDRGATAMLAANAEYDFKSFLLAGHVGPHFRPARGLGVESDLYVGSELRYAVGAYVPLRDNRLRLGAELWGSTGVEELAGESTFFKERNTTIEWLAQARFLVSRDKRTFVNAGGGTRLSNGYGAADLRLLASIGRWWGFQDKEPPAPPPRVRVVPRSDHHAADSDGDGYPDDIDACPDVKEDGKKPNPTDGCPAPADADGDGIPDAKDKCPNEPEDFDGIQDKDGCPEKDADSDAVLDVVDKCPMEPGPPNKDAEKNGCPTLTKVSSDGTVSLMQPIQFQTGLATILPVSFPILDEVVTLMKARGDMKVAVEGHTDSKGAHDYNVKLSDQRAAAVRRYLEGKGIAPSRLTSKGFGPDKPVASNDTDEGRAKNRRVDFVIEGGAAAAQTEDAAWE